MTVYYNALLELLPGWVRAGLRDADGIRELRLRVGQAPQCCTGAGVRELCPRAVSAEDISYLVSMATRGSAYAVSTLAQGYITARGGHRIGLCGTAIIKNGVPTGMKDYRSACIRIARDMPGIGAKVYPRLQGSSVLILGPPGSGKTTLARDLIRELSKAGQQISVVDTRQELFPPGDDGFCFNPGPCTDVLTGAEKAWGIETVLCSMSPGWIALDEISREADCEIMERAGYCGVRFLATCHARSRDELARRPVYRSLLNMGLFRMLITMKDDCTFTMEELE